LATAIFAFAATTLTAQGIETGDGTGKLAYRGELLGMYTLGLADDAQAVALPETPLGSIQKPQGVFDNTNNGKNGYMTRMDFSVLYEPVPWVELFIQLRARSRLGNPYIPLTLEVADSDGFGLSFENAWGRANLIKGARSESPFDLFVQAGKFSASPKSFHLITGFSTESIMSRHRLATGPTLQLEAAYRGAEFAESLSLSLATSQRMNESITPIYDGDGSKGRHGEQTIEELYALPLFAAARIAGIKTEAGRLDGEFVYAMNADGIYSGNNFAANIRFDLSPGPEGMTVPISLAAAMTEKNMDPLARASHGLGNRNALFLGEGLNSNHNDSYLSTVSFRRSMRLAFASGIRFSPAEKLAAEANIGFSHSQIAHIYRETLVLNSASLDFKITHDERFFLGGGIFLGTLGDAVWKSRDRVGDEANPETGFERIYALADNMGFEAHAGVKMGSSRFVLGYNLNKGLSMNHGLEALSEAQSIHLQSGSSIGENLFQTGGFFTKLVIAW